MFGKSAGYYQAKLQKARANKSRYVFIAKKLSYTEQVRLKSFPLFNKGANKGGIIIEQKTVREHPIGLVAKRTIGYERSNEDGKGLEYAFRNYLNGKNGHRMMQKIAKANRLSKELNGKGQGVFDEKTQKFKLIARDSSYLPIENALIQIERKYIENGTFYITEIPKTDEKGVTSASLQVNDVIYNFKIYQDGVLISEFTNVLAICQTPLVTQCEIDFNAFQETITLPDFEEGDDFNFTLGYNSTSRVITSQFTIPSGEPSLVELIVTSQDTLSTSVCSDTLTSSSGLLTCPVPNNFGNSTVTAKLYKDSVQQGMGTVKLDQKAKDIYGVILIILSVIVIITLIGMSISDNPVITAIFLFVGVVVLFSLNLVEGSGFIGASATILFLAIAIILVIIKVRRNA
jgi:hypothetical protein